MIRTSLVLAFALSPAAWGWSQSIHLEGEIVDGIFLEQDSNGMALSPATLFDDFPAPYTAIFHYEPASALAGFEFTASFGGPPMGHEVRGNIFPGVHRNDAAALVIDFDEVDGPFVTSFELMLDKTTGQGAWDWSEDCLVCDFIFGPPSASATITGFRVVPEPASLAMALLGGMMSMVVQRRRAEKRGRQGDGETRRRGDWDTAYSVQSTVA